MKKRSGLIRSTALIMLFCLVCSSCILGSSNMQSQQTQTVIVCAQYPSYMEALAAKEAGVTGKNLELGPFFRSPHHVAVLRSWQCFPLGFMGN